MKNKITNNPLFKVLIILSIIFIGLLLKMENRRYGYTILKLQKIEKKANDIYLDTLISYASLTRPSRIEKLAQEKLSLIQPNRAQVIQIAGNKAMTTRANEK